MEVWEGDDGQAIFTFGNARIELPAVKELYGGSSSLSTSVWAASVLLCRLLAQMKEKLASKRVLEVIANFMDRQ